MTNNVVYFFALSHPDFNYFGNIPKYQQQILTISFPRLCCHRKLFIIIAKKINKLKRESMTVIITAIVTLLHHNFITLEKPLPIFSDLELLKISKKNKDLNI